MSFFDRPWHGCFSSWLLSTRANRSLLPLLAKMLCFSQVCSVPAGLMLLGSLSVLCVQFSSRVSEALEHLGAGLVTGAVTMELLPILTTAPRACSP